MLPNFCLSQNVVRVATLWDLYFLLDTEVTFLAADLGGRWSSLPGQPLVLWLKPCLQVGLHSPKEEKWEQSGPKSPGRGSREQNRQSLSQTSPTLSLGLQLQLSRETKMENEKPNSLGSKEGKYGLITQKIREGGRKRFTSCLAISPRRLKK